MHIAILGSGHVGQELAKGLRRLGHDITLGSRQGNKLGNFLREFDVREATFAEAIVGADVVIVAVQGAVAEDLVTSLADLLAGKVVVDTTNPIAGEARDGIVPYFTGADESLLQRLQAAAPAARFVKCWNSVAAHMMVQPKVAGGTPSMFICGDDANAKQTVADLVATCGWAVEDVGTSTAGHAVEALCQLWCAPGFLRGDWAHAFAVLRP
ncbi:MAG: NAD(P)-binding domain-containing protein [Candidatus Sericytochromatia bacterium]|nr:NAD(P)-binding domain-containing protein [Candidatus Sericytochromatia bacterium]